MLTGDILYYWLGNGQTTESTEDTENLYCSCKRILLHYFSVLHS